MKLQHPLFRFAIVIAMLPAALPQAGAADATDQCPRFQFNPPPTYKGGMKYSFYAPGSAGAKTDAFTSVCSGVWRTSSPRSQNWSITVIKKDDPKVASAYDARDGYAADLARADSEGATPYLYARFQNFSFPWGNAVGYFVQTTKNASWPEPNNGQLFYEIRGVTNDHLDTIVARFAVRHPELPAGPSVQDAQGNIRTLTSFPSYKLLGKSKPESFEPNLDEVQDIVSSVVILKPKTVQKPENTPAKPE
jgi:hypothetical protein